MLMTTVSIPLFRDHLFGILGEDLENSFRNIHVARLHGNVGYQGLWSFASGAIPYLSGETNLHGPDNLGWLRMPQEERDMIVEC